MPGWLGRWTDADSHFNAEAIFVVGRVNGVPFGELPAAAYQRG